MPRSIWMKEQSAQNGTWNLHEGDPPFSIPAVGGTVYDIRTDTGEAFVITAQMPSTNDMEISGLTVSDQSPDGEVILSYSVTEDGPVAGVLTRSAVQPSAVRVIAEQDDQGDPASSAFSDQWTINGNDTLPDIEGGLPEDTYYLHVVPVGGNDIDVVTSNGFSLDTTAPQVSSAQTQPAGDQVSVQFSEPLLGTTTTSDWALLADGLAMTIDTVVNVGQELTLTLLGLVTPGQVLTLSYSGSGLRDAVNNTIPVFTGVSVLNTVAADFNENTILVPSGSYLTANDPLPTDARSLLFFASLTQDPGTNSRTALASWDGSTGGFHSQYTAGSGSCGIRMSIRDGTGSLSVDATPVALGTRYHVLVSAWTNDIELRALAYIYDTSTGVWSEVINEVDVSAPGTSLDFSFDNLRLFTRSDGSNQNFAGNVNRTALWASENPTPLADIAQANIRDLFTTANALANPANSRVLLGQPLVDFDGDVATYNAGQHNGTFGDFTVEGDF